jgi:myosin III
MDLLQKMVAGTPHFVRCIKPNDVKVPKCFEEQKVLKQLRYAGVLETIHIRQNGFSHRFSFADFLKKYCFLAFGFDERVIANRESCRLLLVRLKIDGWALGKSKAFLKYYHIEYLSKLYEEQVKKIILVQSYVRRWLAKSRVNKIRKEKLESALTLQRHVRGWLTRKKIKMMENRKKIEEKSANEKNQIAMMNAMQFVSRANILRRIEQKENIEAENKAAMVIQKCKCTFKLLLS